MHSIDFKYVLFIMLMLDEHVNYPHMALSNDGENISVMSANVGIVPWKSFVKLNGNCVMLNTHKI